MKGRGFPSSRFVDPISSKKILANTWAVTAGEYLFSAKTTTNIFPWPANPNKTFFYLSWKRKPVTILEHPYHRAGSGTPAIRQTAGIPKPRRRPVLHPQHLFTTVSAIEPAFEEGKTGQDEA